ncbi:SDR family oxidoreductase [Shewanella sp. D64]|uniref:UDP-glucose 4-epimerase family protein n=1 Tax=unclassified Shewanella TaxID=196818 RepID=UPI0022BA2053|nr:MULTISPECIES: SDR family oxidoreductase [unclassified Shewanella]MEC4727741.1 SDR family oxidoreductase [Shewanella sp. D64]MEC4737504.1 SDR family oxidoreductase [Shewanella sp. E94]WBJ97314.1 SDR family oxidoreductase [Shewanella sp. MTB7]
MHNILLTGGSGFLGKHLLKKLSKFQLSVLDRSVTEKDEQFTYFKASIDSKSSYSLELKNVKTVIHCAARVHIMNEQISDPLSEFREINTAGTVNLARQAVTAGVKRFIFVSSIKVNGESTQPGRPFSVSDARKAEDFYGQSKLEAEEQLLELAKETGLEVVIIRPTLVYGPDVKANFASLMNLVSKGIPLPFGCITDNRRSLVSVSNLVDLILTCIDHPKAANQVFLVSDDHDVSTASMVMNMSQALGKSSKLLPVPLWCYRLVGKLAGKTDVVNRLLGSLQVDITHTKDTLGWVPPQTLEDGFRETAEAFLLNKNK